MLKSKTTVVVLLALLISACALASGGEAAAEVRAAQILLAISSGAMHAKAGEPERAEFGDGGGEVRGAGHACASATRRRTHGVTW